MKKNTLSREFIIHKLEILLDLTLVNQDLWDLKEKIIIIRKTLILQENVTITLMQMEILFLKDQKNHTYYHKEIKAMLKYNLHDSLIKKLIILITRKKLKFLLNYVIGNNIIIEI